jgi:anti-sigma B factor antagonist
MAAPQGTIRVHKNDQRILFRVEGWAQMDLGVALRRTAEQWIKQGITTLLVDLQECCYMDSTFLGSLLFLKRTVEQRPGGQLALISPAQKCNTILEQMGILEVFPITTAAETATGEWTCLNCDMNDVEAFHMNVFQAHEQLACLPGPAAEPFKKMVRMMKQEMEDETVK